VIGATGKHAWFRVSQFSAAFELLIDNQRIPLGDKRAGHQGGKG